MKDTRSEQKSQTVKDFHGRPLPEPGRLAACRALVEKHKLAMPLPTRLAAVAERHKKVSSGEWRILTPRHRLEDTLAGQLTFALKWEGVDLGVLAALFKVVLEDEIAQVVLKTPTGACSRRLGFFYEWLTERKLNTTDPGKVRTVAALDPEL